MYRPSLDEFKELSKRGNLIPVFREILADEETPVTALMKLKSSAHVFLLESVEGGEKWGRYTFLGADPRFVFRVVSDEVEIRENGSTRRLKHGGNPLACLKKLLSRFKPVSVGGLPRFYGGAVGYLSYGMVRHFEKKLMKASTGDASVHDAVFLVSDTLLIFDNVRHTIKVVSCARVEEGDDDLDGIHAEAVRKIDSVIEALRRPLFRNAAAVTPGGRPDVAFKSNMSPAEFKGIVQRARDYIGQGDIIQVVLSQRFETENSLDPVDLYRALRYINPSPYLFFLRLDDLCLIGSSPEVMVRLEDGVAELRPIAGTKKRGKTEQEDRILADELLSDPKEKAEHVMLVDLGRNDLGRIARVGSVQVNSFMTVERYSHVMHLVSNIQAQLAEGKDGFDVLRAAFPAGTLTGAPKIRAMEIIDELEPSERGPYGGAVGYFSFSGNMDFCITIRTMVLRDGRIYIQAGAGIVADSDPDREYEETMSKAAAMMKAVRMAASDFEIREEE